MYNVDQAHCQQVAFTNGGSTASTYSVGSQKLLLYATAECFIDLQGTPVAGTSGAAFINLPATTYFELKTKAANKIAARGASGSGTLYVMPLLDDKKS